MSSSYRWNRSGFSVYLVAGLILFLCLTIGPFWYAFRQLHLLIAQRRKP
jgi:hypothetical protein